MTLRAAARKVWRLPVLRHAVPHRLFLVSWKAVLVFALAYAVPAVSVAVAQWWAARQSPPLPEFRVDRLVVAKIQAGVVCVGAVCYGLARLGRYHPRRRQGYAAWLEQTPWTWRKPLPLGPVTLGWRDLLVLGALAAGAAHAGVNPAVPLILFGAPYLTTVATTVAGTGAAPEATVLGFGVPTLLFLRDRPWAALLLTAAMYAVAYRGLRRSLARFPWRDPEEEKVHPSMRPPKYMSWPMAEIGPLAPKPPMSWAKALLIPALTGWWLYAVVALPAVSEWLQWKLSPLSPLFWASVIGVVIALCRMLNYGGSAPISLSGRLRHGPLLIPRYDQVYAAPLASALLAGVAPTALHALGLSMTAASAASIALVLAATINLPPTKYRWKLTGGYHAQHSREITMDEAAALS